MLLKLRGPHRQPAARNMNATLPSNSLVPRNTVVRSSHCTSSRGCCCLSRLVCKSFARALDFWNRKHALQVHRSQAMAKVLKSIVGKTKQTPRSAHRRTGGSAHVPNPTRVCPEHGVCCPPGKPRPVQLIIRIGYSQAGRIKQASKSLHKLARPIGAGRRVGRVLTPPFMGPVPVRQ